MPAASMAGGAPKSVQMNVRLDREDKRRGDAALAAMGFTPTQAVKSLWALAAGDAKDLDFVSELLRRGRDRQLATASDGTTGEADDVLARGWALYEDACKEVGVSGGADHGRADDELLEQALLDRYGEGRAS